MIQSVYLVNDAGGWTMTIFGSLAMLGAYTSWWLGVTGRADRLLGTVDAEVTTEAEVTAEAEVTTE